MVEFFYWGSMKSSGCCCSLPFVHGCNLIRSTACWTIWRAAHRTVMGNYVMTIIFSTSSMENVGRGMGWRTSKNGNSMKTLYGVSFKQTLQLWQFYECRLRAIKTREVEIERTGTGQKLVPAFLLLQSEIQTMIVLLWLSSWNGKDEWSISYSPFILGWLILNGYAV